MVYNILITATTFTTNTKQLTVTVERIFDASLASVWRTLTDPALIPLWWGGPESPTIVDKMDVRASGEWRFIRKSPEGTELAFSGKYVDVTPERLLVQTFNFEPSGPGHESTRTTTLEPVDDDHTKMTAVFTYEKPEDLQADLDAGMEAGTRATWDRLTGLLSSKI